MMLRCVLTWAVDVTVVAPHWSVADVATWHALVHHSVKVCVLATVAVAQNVLPQHIHTFTFTVFSLYYVTRFRSSSLPQTTANQGSFYLILEMGSVTPSSEKIGNAIPYANKNGYLAASTKQFLIITKHIHHIVFNNTQT